VGPRGPRLPAHLCSLLLVITARTGLETPVETPVESCWSLPRGRFGGFRPYASDACR
jgi:hypothetical protein